MEFDHRKRHASIGPDAMPSAPVPGKQTLTQRMVQMHSAATPSSERSEPAPVPPPVPVPSGPRPTLQMLFGRRDRASDPDHVHGAAARGTATAATQLPHLAQIQKSFGKHDISGVQAHVGAEAAASAQEMGATAYATGNHVVLGAGTDLHTVAHEAAHVVQQRAGVHLKGGVGEVGDPYERQADEVADAVVRGESAEGLLDDAMGCAIAPCEQRRPGRRPSRLHHGPRARRAASDDGRGTRADASLRMRPDTDAESRCQASARLRLAVPSSARGVHGLRHRRLRRLHGAAADSGRAGHEARLRRRPRLRRPPGLSLNNPYPLSRS